MDAGRMRAALAAAAILCACDAGSEQTIDLRDAEHEERGMEKFVAAGQSGDEPSDAAGGAKQLGNKPGASRGANELFGENVGVILLDPEAAEPDKNDPNTLHIRTPPGHDGFVLAGAAALADALEPQVDDLSKHARIVIAQSLLSSLAGADLVVVATVAEVSAPIIDEEGASTHSVMVTFNVEETVLGSGPATITVRMFDGSLKVADLLAAPVVGTRHLVLLQHKSANWRLAPHRPLRPVVDGYVGGFPGVRLPIASLVDVAKEHEGVLP